LIASGNSFLSAAREAWQRGDAATAEAQCRKALAASATDAAAWTLLGIILRHRDTVAAESALHRAISLDSRYAEARFHLGNLYREHERFSDAVAAYEATLALSPGHPSVLNNLALALEGIGDIAQATITYRALLSLQPAHRQALGNLARLLCRGRHYAEARELCERYLRQFPEGDASVLVDYGICQAHDGDNAGAETSFRRALALAPDDALILTNLGSSMVDHEDFEGAAPVSLAIAHDHSRFTPWRCSPIAARDVCVDWTGRIARPPPPKNRGGRGCDQSVRRPFAAIDTATQLRIARQWAQSVRQCRPQ
jgi:Flp pilus assembly protein TadD